MKTNRETFIEKVSTTDANLLSEIELRNANREWIRKSKKIAIKVLVALDNLDWTQKQLAKEMNVSPQYINKIVKGQENLTLETITKLERILDIEILHDTHLDNNKNIVQFSSYKSPYKNDFSIINSNTYIHCNA